MSGPSTPEEDLLRERELSSSLLESMADGVVACDANGELALFNRAAREWHGVDPMRLPAEEWARHYDLYRYDGVTPLPTEEIPLARAYRGETFRDAGMAIVAKGKPPRFILANGCPIQDATGRKVGAVVVMRDVTELRRADEALRRANVDLERRVADRTAALKEANRRLQGELQERKRAEEAAEQERALLRCVLDSAEDVIFLKDRDGAYRGCNKAAEASLGLTEAEQIGKSDFDLFDPEMAEASRAIDRRVVETGAPVRSEEWVTCADGHRALMDTVKVPYRGPDGSILGLVGVARDITDRRQAEEAARANLARFEERFKEAVIPLCFVDKEGGGLLFNTAFEKTFGYSRDEVPTLNEWWTLACPDEEYREWVIRTCENVLREALPAGTDVEPIEYQITCKNGDVLTMVVFASMAGGDLLLTFFDVTERNASLHFLESMDRVNRAIQSADDLDAMRDVLDAVLSILDCDRAFLLHPSDPGADTWSCPMESTKPRCPGVRELGMVVPIGADVAETMTVLLQAEGPVQFGPGTEHPLPADVAQRFGFRNSMGMAIHPKVGMPWQLGVHQCCRERVWTQQEEQLFREIGRRLTDALTGLLVRRDLRESQRRLAEAQRIARLGHWERDLATGQDSLSAEAQRILGLPAAPMDDPARSRDEPWLDRVHPDDRNGVQLAVTSAAGGGPACDLTVRAVRPSGEERIVRIVGEVKRDAAGEPLRLFGVMHDVTERRMAEEELRESERRLADAQRIAHVGYWERDFDSQTITLSDESCRIFGLSPSDVPLPLREWQSRWMELVHAEDQPRIRKAAADALQGGPPFDMEYRVVRSGGEVRFVHSEGVVNWDATGRPVSMAGMMQDITERKTAEEEIRRLNLELEQRVADRTAELEATNQELEAFAYSVSHDLRAPLRHVDGFVDLLAKCIASTEDDDARHYMEVITESARRMGQLIDDLLAFSRMGRAEMALGRVELEPLVREAVAELAPEAAGRKVRWRVAELPAVIGDRMLLRTVLSNLLGNALKFTRPREVAEIEVGWQPGDAGQTVIYVHDNGVGFDPRYANKLFGVFQRLHRSDDFEGTGIGLANVRRIVARHGGRTWAQGSLDRGATFFFSLPAPWQDE